FGGPCPEAGHQEVDHQRVQDALRGREDEAPVDELGVRRKPGESVEIIRPEPLGRRKQPIRNGLSAHPASCSSPWGGLVARADQRRPDRTIPAHAGRTLVDLGSFPSQARFSIASLGGPPYRLRLLAQRVRAPAGEEAEDRKSTRLNSSH